MQKSARLVTRLRRRSGDRSRAQGPRRPPSAPTSPTRRPSPQPRSTMAAPGPAGAVRSRRCGWDSWGGPGRGVSKSVAKAPRAGIGREKNRGISTILLARSGVIGAFATDLDKQRRRGPIVRDDRGAPPLHAPELHRREESDAPCPRIARDVSQHLALPEIMRHDIFRRSWRKGRGRGQWSPPPSCSRTWGTSGPTTATASLTPPREPGALTTRAPVASREVTPTSPRDRPDSGVLVSP